jgi:hypothetical protein
LAFCIPIRLAGHLYGKKLSRKLGFQPLHHWKRVPLPAAQIDPSGCAGEADEKEAFEGNLGYASESSWLKSRHDDRIEGESLGAVVWHQLGSIAVEIYGEISPRVIASARHLNLQPGRRKSLGIAENQPLGGVQNRDAVPQVLTGLDDVDESQLFVLFVAAEVQERLLALGLGRACLVQIVVACRRVVDKARSNLDNERMNKFPYCS